MTGEIRRNGAVTKTTKSGNKAHQCTTPFVKESYRAGFCFSSACIVAVHLVRRVQRDAVLVGNQTCSGCVLRLRHRHQCPQLHARRLVQGTPCGSSRFATKSLYPSGRLFVIQRAGFRYIPSSSSVTCQDTDFLV